MARRVVESVWDERREWVQRQQQSGLSVAKFCRDNGLQEGNFHAWRLRFAKATGQTQVAAGKLVRRHQAQQAFVHLPLPQATMAVAAGISWIEISVADGMVVRLPAANLAALEMVLSRLNPSLRETRHA
jgi:transposase-like protein